MTDDADTRRRALTLQQRVARTRKAYDDALAERDGFFLENSNAHGGRYSHVALGKMAGGLPSMTIGRAVESAIKRASGEQPAKRNPGGAARHRPRSTTA